MNRNINKQKLENALDTAEVIIPNSKEVRRQFSEFVPMIVSIISVINLVVSAILGRDFIPISDEQVYLIVSGTVSLVAIVVTAWKNTHFSKKAKQREEIANQVISKPTIKDIIK